VKISDVFLNDGVILSTVGRGNVEMEKDMANVSGTEPPYPVLILINEGSASASEIIAGALQYNDRAIVAGSESFGKGSVQTIIETGGGTALKMTIARYLPAGEFSVQLEGVAPDIEILPAVVDKEQINLFRDKTLSEADLEKHLEKDTNSKNLPKPKYLLRYLKPKSGDEDLDEISRREYSKKPSFEDDFPVQFATKFLTLAGKSSRNEMLKTGKGTIDGMNAEENAKIKKALASLGVDWSEAPKTHAKPGLHLGSSIYSGEKIISRARAGDKIELKLVATNSGKGDFSQLVAIGQSEDNAFLSDREFPFGLLKADQTRKWSIPIELPEHLPTQDLVMAVEFREENGNAPEKTEVVIPVQGLEQPVFSFSYSVPTKNLSKNFESGQSIPFDVEITNLGKGKSSEDTSAAITDKCDDKIFIENGRVKLGVMKPGDKKKEKFRFHTLAGYDPSKCKMVLSIVDAKLATGLSKELDVNPSTGTISPQPGTVLYPPSIEIGEYPLTTKKKIERITGNIESKNGIFDYYVFVGNNKIAYETNPKGLNKLPLALDIELKEGSNKIIIVARNPEKIARSKTIVIHRTKSK
jgi:carboxyl-terminal processing protease